jgi:hypothetical protein
VGGGRGETRQENENDTLFIYTRTRLVFFFLSMHGVRTSISNRTLCYSDTLRPSELLSRTKLCVTSDTLVLAQVQIGSSLLILLLEGIRKRIYLFRELFHFFSQFLNRESVCPNDMNKAFINGMWNRAFE